MSRLFILLLADCFGTTYADTGLTNKPVATSFPAASQFPFSTSRATSCAIDLLMWIASCKAFSCGWPPFDS